MGWGQSRISGPWGWSSLALCLFFYCGHRAHWRRGYNVWNCLQVHVDATQRNLDRVSENSRKRPAAVNLLSPIHMLTLLFPLLIDQRDGLGTTWVAKNVGFRTKQTLVLMLDLPLLIVEPGPVAWLLKSLCKMGIIMCCEVEGWTSMKTPSVLPSPRRCSPSPFLWLHTDEKKEKLSVLSWEDLSFLKKAGEESEGWACRR